MTTPIHAELERKKLLPAEHIVDMGYVDAYLLVSSLRDYQIDLVGPARKNSHWQASENTDYDLDHFPIDWDKHCATCPQGHTSVSWKPTVNNQKNEVIRIRFSMADCRACPAQSLCTPFTRPPRRTLTVRPQAEYLALRHRREQETAEDFTKVYHQRAGIEGTISQGVRTMGLRRSRYLGEEKTHLQHVATAAALNLIRSMAWFDRLPRAQTRRSAFARLYNAA